MSAPSSSAVKLWEATGCPRALHFMRTGARRDTSVFNVGIAAHAVMQAAQEAQAAAGAPLAPEAWGEIAAQVVAGLSTVGRRFRGNTEPPMPIHAAHAGATVALRYLRSKGYALAPGAIPERELSATARWEPCDPNDRRAAWTGILDSIAYDEDPETGDGVLTVTDYKTAWPAGPKEVESLQLRGQALLGIAHARALFDAEPVIVVREIVNLRTGVSTFAQNTVEDLALEDDRAETVAVAASIPRADGPPNPGIGCASCPYAETVCKDAAQTAADPLTAYALHTSRSEALRDAAQTAAADVEPLNGLPGYRLVEVAEPAPDAAERLLQAYAPDLAEDLRLLSLIQLLAGTTGIRAAAKRAKLNAADLLTTSTATRFTVK